MIQPSSVIPIQAYCHQGNASTKRRYAQDLRRLAQDIGGQSITRSGWMFQTRKCSHSWEEEDCP